MTRIFAVGRVKFRFLGRDITTLKRREQIDDDFRAALQTVTPELIEQAIAEATGAIPLIDQRKIAAKVSARIEDVAVDAIAARIGSRTLFDERGVSLGFEIQR